MARPAKPLESLVREGTFRARRHAARLADPELPWPGFARLQRRYLECEDESERREVARAFERAVGTVQEQMSEELSRSGGAVISTSPDVAGGNTTRTRAQAQIPSQSPQAAAATLPGDENAKRALPRLALSPSEAAAALGVSRDFFDEHIAPELRIVRRGRRKLVAIRELERWLAEESAFALERTR